MKGDRVFLVVRWAHAVPSEQRLCRRCLHQWLEVLLLVAIILPCIFGFPLGGSKVEVLPLRVHCNPVLCPSFRGRTSTQCAGPPLQVSFAQETRALSGVPKE